MIKSDAQRERTAAQVAGVSSSARQSRPGDDEQARRSRSRELRRHDPADRGRTARIRDQAGALALPDVERLDQIAPFTEDADCEGVSQTKFARRLGVSKQVISW